MVVVMVVVRERVGLDGQEAVSFVWLQVGPAGRDTQGTVPQYKYVVRYESRRPGKAKPPWSERRSGTKPSHAWKQEKEHEEDGKGREK